MDSEIDEIRANALTHGYPICDLEKERLEILRNLEVLDSDGDRAFDQMTQLACLVFDCPIALVSLVDADRQWFLSHTGLPVKETPRELAFCNRPVAEAATGRKQWPFVVWNAEEDERFSSNALVTGFPDIRFYAGVPLVMDKSKNLAIGTLCLLDNQPRNEVSFSPGDQEKLAAMADVVVNILLGLKQRTNMSRRLQKQTIVNMGHQMLNPLHALRDVTAQIKEEVNIPSELLQGLETSVDQLTAAIESASTMDVLSELQAKFTPTLFSPADTIRDLVNFFRPLVPSVHFQVVNELDADGAVHRIRLQRAKFAKCIGHLFSIALRGVADITQDAELDPAIAVTQRLKANNQSMNVVVTFKLDERTKELLVSLAFDTGALPHLRLTANGFSFVDAHLFVAKKLAEQLGGRLDTPTAADLVHGISGETPHADATSMPNGGSSSRGRARSTAGASSSSTSASAVTGLSILPQETVVLTLCVPNPVVAAPSLDPVDFVPAMRKLADSLESVDDDDHRELGDMSPGPRDSPSVYDENDSAHDLDMKASRATRSQAGDDAAAPVAGTTGAKPTCPIPKESKSSAAGVAHVDKRQKTAHNATAYIIDDEPVNRMIMSRTLTKAGFQRRNIIAFADGDQVPLFFSNGRKAEPDVCFLDIVMHRLNGDELCKQMREAGWTCPIVAVTGNVIEEDRLLDIGFDFVVKKPFDAAKIYETLASTAHIY